jgi:hypothetical protein
LGNVIFPGLATGKAQVGQLKWVTLPGDDGANNSLPGLAHHIADDGGQLHIHLQQGLLQVHASRVR